MWTLELNGDATYLVRRLGSISFQMLWDDVLGLNDVPFVLGLKKNRLSVSCMEDLRGVVEFDG